MENKILFVGPKPPPATGFANIVIALKKVFINHNLEVKFISTLPPVGSSLFPTYKYKLLRLLFFPYSLIKFSLCLFKKNIVYINIHGGLSQIYDIFIIALSRIFNKRIFLHHNSCSYVNEKSLISNILFRLAGKESTHIVSCLSMQNKIRETYYAVNNVRYVSNLAILSLQDKENFIPVYSSNISEEEIKIGYMSYVNKEKGIQTFCKTINGITKSNISKKTIKGIVAGPIFDEDFVQNQKNRPNNNIDFQGALYGKAFEDFFKSIDILLFPTEYKHEAEPLTIYHSLSFGVPVISTQLGCLDEMLNSYDSCFAVSQNNFVSFASNFINEYTSKSLNERNKIRINLINEFRNQRQVEELKFFEVYKYLSIINE